MSDIPDVSGIQEGDSIDSTVFRDFDFQSLNNEKLTDIKAKFNALGPEDEKESVDTVQTENIEPTQNKNSVEQRPSIMKRLSPFGFSLFRYRLLQRNQLRLVQRNGTPELVTFSGFAERRKKVWSIWPWTWFKAANTSSHTVQILTFKELENQGYLGYGDRHLILVKQGYFARVKIDGLPTLLKPGVHILKTNNFDYKDQVSQDDPHISHETCHFLRIPPGKLATVRSQNVSQLWTGSHAFRSNNFQIHHVKTNTLFYDLNDANIGLDQLRRLLPKAGELAVYSIGTKIHTYGTEQEEQEEAKILNSPNVRFIGFLSTNLQNCNFPAPEEKQEYYKYYTQDLVLIGVKLYIIYSIRDPEKVLAKLKFNDINEHVRRTTHTDMLKVIKEFPFQQLQTSKTTKPVDPDFSSHRSAANPSAPPRRQHKKEYTEN